MSWNYRVVEYYSNENPGNFDIPEEEKYFYHIHEVYYDEEGNIQAWSENPDHPFGLTDNELKEDLNKMLEAFNKPVLKFDSNNYLVEKG